MGKPTYLYHADNPKGEIFDSDEVEEKLKEGWTENHLEAEEQAAAKKAKKTEKKDDGPEPTEWDDLKVDQLKAVCSGNDIPFAAKATKPEIIKLIEGAEVDFVAWQEAQKAA